MFYIFGYRKKEVEILFRTFLSYPQNITCFKLTKSKSERLQNSAILSWTSAISLKVEAWHTDITLGTKPIRGEIFWHPAIPCMVCFENYQRFCVLTCVFYWTSATHLHTGFYLPSSLGTKAHTPSGSQVPFPTWRLFTPRGGESSPLFLNSLRISWLRKD